MSLSVYVSIGWSTLWTFFGERRSNSLNLFSGRSRRLALRDSLKNVLIKYDRKRNFLKPFIEWSMTFILALVRSLSDVFDHIMWDIYNFSAVIHQSVVSGRWPSVCQWWSKSEISQGLASFNKSVTSLYWVLATFFSEAILKIDLCFYVLRTTSLDQIHRLSPNERNPKNKPKVPRTIEQSKTMKLRRFKRKLMASDWFKVTVIVDTLLGSSKKKSKPTLMRSRKYR